MSLLLKGSVGQSVYAQENSVSIASASAVAFYARVIPADNCSAPFIFIMDGPLDGSPRTFYLRQDSPTLMTVGCVTSNGSNEHQFSVASGVYTDVLSVFDIDNQQVIHYIDGGTPTQTFSSVGTPTTPSAFGLRLVTPNVEGEIPIVGDLAIWDNGKPDAAALTALENNEYLGWAFKDSGCSARYCFVGDEGPLATEIYINTMQSPNYLRLERETNPQPTNNNAQFLPTQGQINTQTSSPDAKYYDHHDAYIDQTKTCKIEAVLSDGNRDLNWIIEQGYYNPKTGRWSGIPDRYPGMESWKIATVIWQVFRRNRDINPELYDGTFVLEWDGNGTMDVSSASNKVAINSNRLEFTGGTTLGITNIPDGGYIENIRCYKKDFEALFSAGRLFTPQWIEYASRYDTIRMMDASNVNIAHYSKWDQTQSMKGNWNTFIPFEAQIRMCLEADTNLWLNISPMAGCGIDVDYTREDSAYWRDLGTNSVDTFNDEDLDEILDNIVTILNQLEFPLTKDIKLEMGNELWNWALPFYRAAHFCNEFGIEIASREPEFDHAFMGGAGFLCTRLMDRFQRALSRGGRSSQVWTPILGVQTAWMDLTRYFLRGATYYITSRDTVFDITRYTPSTTGYLSCRIDYKTDNSLLGQTYPTKSGYYDAIRDMVDPDTASRDAGRNYDYDPYYARRLFHTRQSEVLDQTIFERGYGHKAELEAFGFVNPIQEYEGSSHNTANSDNEWTEPALEDFLFNYNFGAPGAAIQRLYLECFSLHNPGGAVSNFQVLGNNRNPKYGAWFEAENWATLSDSLNFQAWEDYIDPPKDIDAVWTAYKSGLQGDGIVTVAPQYTAATFEVVDIDEASIRANYNVISTSVADASRTSGSVFNRPDFDTIDLEGGEFFYQTNSGGATYTPIVSNSNFTGFFDISGNNSSLATMYYHDVVNDEWYEMVVNSVGPALAFNVNNVLNVETSTSVDLIGTVYGDDSATVSGINLTFSNDGGSTWNATASLISGVTQYKRTVTSNASPDSVDTYTIEITDGTDSFEDTVDVVTRVQEGLAFSSASESINFSENFTGVIATFVATGEGTITYSLDGTDAGSFTVNSSTGAITVPTGVNFEDPSDANGDGIFVFDLVANNAGEEARLSITATVTDVAEHVFTFTAIDDVVDRYPSQIVEITRLLSGGVAGQTFTVAGSALESSNDGGSTFSTSEKTFVAGQTYIRFSTSAEGTYNTTSTISGTLAWSNNTESLDISFDITTKSPLVPVDMGNDVAVDHVEGINAITVSTAPVSGEAPFTYSITGGADAALFTINATSGALFFTSAPSFDGSAEPDNEYVVEITASNSDGFSSSDDSKVITVTVTSAGVVSTDLPDFSIVPTSMSDGTWTTDPDIALRVIGTPSGVGANGVKAYHDVIKFVKRPKTRTVTITSIDGNVNVAAAIAFAGKYLELTPASPGAGSVDLTVTDDGGNSISFTYNITAS